MTSFGRNLLIYNFELKFCWKGLKLLKRENAQQVHAYDIGLRIQGIMYL